MVTMFYTRHEVQMRVGIFFSAGSMAGAFSGLLAFAIQKMEGVGGLEGWRWSVDDPQTGLLRKELNWLRIFILEGLLTLVVGVGAAWTLPNDVETSKFLTPIEREVILRRLRSDADQGGDQVIGESPFEWKYLIQCVTDWKIYLSVIVFWGNSIASYGFVLLELVGKAFLTGGRP